MSAARLYEGNSNPIHPQERCDGSTRVRITMTTATMVGDTAPRSQGLHPLTTMVILSPDPVYPCAKPMSKAHVSRGRCMMHDGLDMSRSVATLLCVRLGSRGGRSASVACSSVRCTFLSYCREMLEDLSREECP